MQDAGQRAGDEAEPAVIDGPVHAVACQYIPPLGTHEDCELVEVGRARLNRVSRADNVKRDVGGPQVFLFDLASVFRDGRGSSLRFKC